MIAHTRLAPAPMRRPNHPQLAGVVVAGAALAITLFGSVGAALAQDCPVTDPTCVIDTVDGTVGDVQKTVDDTTNTAKDEVATATDKVRTTLDELTGSGGQPPGGGTGGGSSGNDGGGTKPDGGGSAGGSVRANGSSAVPSILARQGGTLTLLDTATLGRTDGGSTDPSHRTSGVATRLRQAATGIALPLLIMLGVVLLFTAIQGRLDRRDPKLALAPMTADVVTFA